MSEDEMLELIALNNLVVDEGNLISGVFIPDGTIRIYDDATLDVWGEGDTLAEAFDQASCRIDWKDG